MPHRAAVQAVAVERRGLRDLAARPALELLESPEIGAVERDFVVDIVHIAI
jgi:hypothetical protein